MIKKTKKTEILSKIKHVLPYLGSFLIVLFIAIFGSRDKTTPSSGSLNMESFASNNFESVSTDQLSEFYVVASLADSMNLASTDAVSSNYVMVNVLNDAGQNSTNKLDKKTITDTSHLYRCGVNTYKVATGDTMDSIADQFQITTDQIRWSNGLKTKDISVGQDLLIPGTPGIVYKVKSGNTIESLASKYGSSVEKIITCNDLETDATLVEGSTIVLPDGSLPETERPEYVAPTPVYTYSYTYSGSTNDRQNMRTIATGFYVNSPGNKMVAGQCTWYAWYMRATDSRSLGALPSASLGNAYSWANVLRGYGYRVDRTPEVGAVFQTTAGWYGHVGYVTAVNDDGSITVREMNYGYAAYRVTESEIPASRVGNFNYIH